MDKLTDKIGVCIIDAFIVSVILMCIWPIGLLLNGQILAFAGLLAALSIILGVYNVVLVLPFTYLVESLLKTRGRRSFYFSIVLQGFIGFIIGFALVSLFNKALHWSYFFNVPCIMCGLVFPMVERWYTTEKGRKEGK